MKTHLQSVSDLVAITPGSGFVGARECFILSLLTPNIDEHLLSFVLAGHDLNAPIMSQNRAYSLQYTKAKARARRKKLRQIMKTAAYDTKTRR